MPPGYPGMSPLMPPSGGLSSTLTGAFQPKVMVKQKILVLNQILCWDKKFKAHLKNKNNEKF